jgi:cyclophilin family peptidyl-prolyl cis-trans isomerase
MVPATREQLRDFLRIIRSREFPVQIPEYAHVETCRDRIGCRVAGAAGPGATADAGDNQAGSSRRQGSGSRETGARPGCRLKYTVAMARTNDPHSAAAEFFINVVDNKRLDYTADTNSMTWGYCVFGKVVAGQDVVDKIKAVPTGAQGSLASDVPLTPVVIEKAEMVQ